MGFLNSLAGNLSGAPPPLQGVGGPIGGESTALSSDLKLTLRFPVIPYYTQHPTQIALRVREHKMSFSGDDFTIKDAVSGAVMFQVDGKALAIRGDKSE